MDAELRLMQNKETMEINFPLGKTESRIFKQIGKEINGITSNCLLFP